jgi:hypothetical protein
MVLPAVEELEMKKFFLAICLGFSLQGAISAEAADRWYCTASGKCLPGRGQGTCSGQSPWESSEGPARSAAVYQCQVQGGQHCAVTSCVHSPW